MTPAHFLLLLKLRALGTGSGSLSRAIARTIAPSGHLFTFEYHAQRASAARQDFLDSGLAGVITVTNRDVCELGYGFEVRALRSSFYLLASSFGPFLPRVLLLI